MRVTLVQLNSIDDVQFNLSKMLELMQIHLKRFDSSLDKTRMFVFPENSLYFRLIEGSQIQALNLHDTSFKKLEKFASLNNVFIHLTTAISEDGVTYNASVLIDPSGFSKIVYRKIHLFDIKLEGQKPVRESDFFSNGSEVTDFEIDGVKFGSSICYDIRFAELYLHHAQKRVDVILIPAAFLVKTGQAHWEVLNRARAIESQAYVLSPGQVGNHQSKDGQYSRQTFGHSIAINPWGEVLHCQKIGVGCFDVVIDKDQIDFVRNQIPMSTHRRLL